MFSRDFTTVTVSRCTLTANGGRCTRGTLSLFGHVHRFLGAPNVLRPGCLPAIRTRKRSVAVVVIGITSDVGGMVSSPRLSTRVRRSVCTLGGCFVRSRFGTLLRVINPGKRFVSAVGNHAVGPKRYVRAS